MYLENRLADLMGLSHSVDPFATGHESWKLPNGEWVDFIPFCTSLEFCVEVLLPFMAKQGFRLTLRQKTTGNWEAKFDNPQRFSVAFEEQAPAMAVATTAESTLAALEGDDD